MSKRRKYFIDQFLKTKDVIYEKRDKEAAIVFAKVRSFICKGEFSSIRVAKNFIDCWLSGYTDNNLATIFNVSEVRVRGIKSQISDELFFIFGDDFISLLSDFENPNAKEKVLEKVYVIEHYLNNSARSYVLSDIITMVKSRLSSSESWGEFSLVDCESEINFLSRHSTSLINSELQKLNLEKLSFLIDLLNDNSCMSKDRIDLMSKLQ